MKNKETTKLKFEVKALGEIEDPNFYHIEGIASTPDIDNAGDIVTPQAMLESFQSFGLPKFPHQHDLEQMPLGTWDSYEIRGDATILKGRIPKVANDSFTERLISLIDMGAYGGLSIGFIVLSAEDQDGNDITSKRNHKGLRIITSVFVFETSLVTVPCNEFAEVLEVKSADFDAEKLKEIKSFYNKQNENSEMKIETKGAMLAEFMNQAIDDKVTGAWNKSDWVASIARCMAMSTESVEEMLAGERDIINEDQAYDLAWALDTFYDVIRQIAVKEQLEKLNSSDEDNIETKNRFENCASVRDIESVLKSLGASKKESQTAISKMKNIKEDLSDSDLEEKKRLSDLALKEEEQKQVEYKTILEALKEIN